MNTQQLTNMATTQGMYFQNILPSFLSVISGLFKALEESSTSKTTLAGGLTAFHGRLVDIFFRGIVCTNVCFLLSLHH